MILIDLKKNNIYQLLLSYNPILTSTITIVKYIPCSYLDIICKYKNHYAFLLFLKQQFSKYQNFKVYQTIQNTIPSIIATFKTEHFLYEF